MSNRSERLILCIDDDPEARSLLEYLLKRGMYETITAGDGRTGIRMARERRPDIILLDIEMPGMNGYEVCLQLQKDPIMAYIPVVFLTAHKQDRDKRKAFAAGAADFLSKPFQLEPLLASIKSQIERTTRWQHLKGSHQAPTAPQSSFENFKQKVSRKLDFSPDKHGRWLQVTPLQLYEKAFDFGFSHQELAQLIAEFTGMPYCQRLDAGSIRIGVLPLAFSKQHHLLAAETAAGVSFILSNPFDAAAMLAMKKCAGPDAPIRYALAEPAAIGALFEHAPAEAGGRPEPSGRESRGTAAAGAPPALAFAPGRAAEEVPAGSGGPPGILVVDDDPESQRLIQRFLAPEGYQVTIAEDGIKALHLLNRQRFDLILSDVAMPNLDGLKLLGILQKISLTTPVLLVSGMADAASEIKGLRLGAEDFLRKPLDKDILLLKIKKALGGGHRPGER